MAVKMQREYEGELNIVLVEVQGASIDEVEAFALDHKWMGSSAIWTTERPFSTGAPGIPNCALLSADGEIVLMGHPITLHKEIEEHIAQSRRQRTAVPDELPKALGSAWKSLARGKLGEAIEAANAVIAKASGDDAEQVVAAARDLVARAEAAADGRMARIDRMIEEGCFADAKALAKQLADDLDGSTQETRAEELLTRLDSDELEPELKAEKSLARLERRLYDKGPDGLKRAFAKFADKHTGTKAADRAAHLAGLLE